MATYRLYYQRNTPTFSDQKFGYVQRGRKGAKYTGNYPYGKSFQSISARRTGGTVQYSTYCNDPRNFLTHGQVEENRLYNKVKDYIVGQKSELMTSTVEWKTSLDMITKRATTLIAAYRALLRFDLPRVARLLALSEADFKKVRRKVKRVRRAPRPSELWLEYWMGWAPLMGDIGNAIEVLTRPYPSEKFSAGISYTKQRREKGGDPSFSNYSLDLRLKGRLAAYGKFRVTNHNAGLADQLGFSNPVLTAWQVVPFSFIVDWFANVGQVLGALTDFVGLELYDTGVAYKRETTVNVAGVTCWWEGTGNKLSKRSWYHAQQGIIHTQGRNPGPLPTPRLVVGLPKLSLTRAATSISLLYEIFLSKKK